MSLLGKSMPQLKTVGDAISFSAWELDTMVARCFHLADALAGFASLAANIGMPQPLSHANTLVMLCCSTGMAVKLLSDPLWPAPRELAQVAERSCGTICSLAALALRTENGGTALDKVVGRLVGDLRESEQKLQRSTWFPAERDYVAPAAGRALDALLELQAAAARAVSSGSSREQSVTAADTERMADLLLVSSCRWSLSISWRRTWQFRAPLVSIFPLACLDSGADSVSTPSIRWVDLYVQEEERAEAAAKKATSKAARKRARRKAAKAAAAGGSGAAPANAESQTAAAEAVGPAAGAGQPAAPPVSAAGRRREYRPQ